MTLKFITAYIETRRHMKFLSIIRRKALLLLSLVFMCSLLILPSDVLAQNGEASDSAEIVDVYATFWPIVPGKTVADSMFWAKQLKEAFGGFFSFGTINQSKYQIELSEKRLVEANKLFKDKDYPNAQKSLDLNKKNRNEAMKLLKKARDEKRKVDELSGRLVTSLENQEKVLRFLLTQLPEDQKGKINEVVKDLTLQISEGR